MADSHLLSRPQILDKTATMVQQITPEKAGWKHVGFEVHDLKAGQSISRSSGDNEICLVFLTGKAEVTAGSETYNDVGERESLFEGKNAHAVYVPAHTEFNVTAKTDLEVALCMAPATGKLKPRHIRPSQIKQSTRGEGTNTRYISDVLPESEEAESLLVVEVITPGGHWSSYPSHKHDSDNLPEESYLEETYYHRFEKPEGFGFQRVYTDDRSLDESIAIHDRDVVMVPRGYHPVAAAHGYNLYYLNVMAGPKRAWCFTTEADHEWLMKKA